MGYFVIVGQNVRILTTFGGSQPGTRHFKDVSVRANLGFLLEGSKKIDFTGRICRQIEAVDAG